MGQRTITLHDAAGREIVVTTLTVLEQYRARAGIRPELKNDEEAVRLALSTAAVRRIDGVPCPFPNSPIMMEATMARLDDDGWLAIGNYIAGEIETARVAAEALTTEGGASDPLVSFATSPEAPASGTPSIS